MKKILLFIIMAILLNSLYILLPWGIVSLKEIIVDGNVSYTFFGFKYITSIIFIIQTIFIFIYFFKGIEGKKIFVFFSIILFIHSTLAITPFNICNSGFRKFEYKQCECLGIEKEKLFQTECIGIMKKCYIKGIEESCSSFKIIK